LGEVGHVEDGPIGKLDHETLRHFLGGHCHAHGNNLYGYRGRVQIYGIKDTYIQSTYIQITYIVFGDHQNTYTNPFLGFRFLPWARLISLSQKS
jgi:hypothetical protein